MSPAVTNRHLSNHEVARTADWIRGRATTPSWAEIRAYVLREHGVERTIEALRRNTELKAARIQRAATPQRRRYGPRPTFRQAAEMATEIDGLRVEIKRLEDEIANLLERNLRLINGASISMITETELDRPLGIINRSPTRLPTSKGTR